MMQLCSGRDGHPFASMPATAAAAAGASAQGAAAAAVRSSSRSRSRGDETNARVPGVPPAGQPPEPAQDRGPCWAGQPPPREAPRSEACWDEDDGERGAAKGEDALCAEAVGSRGPTFYRVPVQHRLSQHRPRWVAEGAMEDSREDEEAAGREEAAWYLLEEKLRVATPRTRRRLVSLFALGQRPWSDGGDSLEGPEGPQGDRVAPGCWCGAPSRPAAERSCAWLSPCKGDVCADVRKADAAAIPAAVGEGALRGRLPTSGAALPSGPSVFWKLPPTTSAPVAHWRPQSAAPGRMTLPLGSRSSPVGSALPLPHGGRQDRLTAPWTFQL